MLVRYQYSRFIQVIVGYRIQLTAIAPVFNTYFRADISTTIFRFYDQFLP